MNGTYLLMILQMKKKVRLQIFMATLLEYRNLIYKSQFWNLLQNEKFEVAEMNEMNRIFKYLIASIIMGVTVFYAVYYTKGEYNYMAFPIAFILNGTIYFSRKKT